MLVGDGALGAIKVLDGNRRSTRHLTAPPLAHRSGSSRSRPSPHRDRGVDGDTAGGGQPSWLRITITGGSAPIGTNEAPGPRSSPPSLMAPWPPTTDVVIAAALQRVRADDRTEDDRTPTT
jgi:hypothetical protein